MQLLILYDEKHKMSQPPDFPTKQEGRRATSSNSTATWLKSKDPRIVRVSKTFGGKDRHSKVCTVRGLRDRRVRLSVPTAIQLYDLQDKLGLNQPSKVFDWLLNAAKHEIDELPPLPIIQSENFIQNEQPMLISDHQEVGVDLEDSSGFPKSKFWNLDFCEEGKDQDQTTFNNFAGGHDVHQNFDSVSGSQILLCPSGATQSSLPSYYGFNIGDRSETS